MDIDSTIASLSALSIDERLVIVQRLWDSIPANTEIAISEAQHRELQRRVAAHAANPKSAISMEELERLRLEP